MYTVDPNADEPIMLITRHIGMDDDDGPGVNGEDFQKELLYLDGMGKRRIQVWINSPGGLVLDGYAIYNAILKSKTKVDTYCVGLAASIAGVIFQAGRNRVMCDYGILMYHNPFGENGDKDPGLEAMRQSIVKMIAARSGANEDVVTGIMKRETFMDADEALRIGFCDSIEVSSELNKKRLSTVSNNNKGYWKESNKILNNLLPQKEDMKRIANKLKLIPDADEQSIIDAIVGIENKAKTAEDKAAELQKKLDDMDKDKRDKQKEYDDCKAELDKAKKDMKDAKDKADIEEDKAKTEKAKNFVKELVKVGKIKNDAGVIAKYEAQFKADFDGTKTLVDGLTNNKNAVKIEDTVIDEANKDLPTMEDSVAQDMARIRNKFIKK